MAAKEKKKGNKNYGIDIRTVYSDCWKLFAHHTLMVQPQHLLACVPKTSRQKISNDYTARCLQGLKVQHNFPEAERGTKLTAKINHSNLPRYEKEQFNQPVKL